MKSVPQSTDRLVMARGGLDQLFDALVRRGFRLVAPTVRDGAIVYDEIALGRAPGRLGGRAGGRALPAASGATTTRSSATWSAPTPGSSSSSRPSVAWLCARRGETAAFRRPGPRTAAASPSSACAPASWTRSRSRTGCFVGGAPPRSRLRRPARGRLHRRGQLLRGRRRPASAPRWAPGPRVERRLRPRADRAARRRRTASWSRSAPSAGASVLSQRAARAARRRPDDRGGGGRRRRARPRRWAGTMPTDGIEELLSATSSTPAGTTSPPAA